MISQSLALGVGRLRRFAISRVRLAPALGIGGDEVRDDGGREDTAQRLAEQVG